MDVKLGSQPAVAPEFNSAQAVFGEIQSTTATLSSQWGTLQSLLASLRAEMANEPAKPNTAGMKAEDAAKVMQKYQGDFQSWQGRVSALQARIERQQDQIEKTTKKLAQLQNVKLPRAQNKDRADYDKWADDQKKAMEALSASTQSPAAQKAMGGDENAEIVRAQINQIVIRAAEFQREANKPNVINTAASSPDLQRTVGTVPPRDSGLTIE